MEARAAPAPSAPAPATSSRAPPPARTRPRRSAGPPNNHQAHNVIATGYPEYTQPQDLIRAFSKFGSVKVEKLNSHIAVLSFADEEQAKAAVDATNTVTVYGEFLTVKPYSAKLANEELRVAQVPKREFTKSKQKGVIIEPNQIGLAGDFHQQLDSILTAVRLTQQDVTALSLLYTDVEAALQALWPGCTAIPFGSITTGLGIKTSDADCFINIPPPFRHPNGNYVNKAKRILQQYPHTFTEILAIPRANTPIVKLFHVPTETNCDLTFKTPLGAQNSKLIAFLLHADPRLLPMAVVIKYWAKVHDLTGTGKLTNYALTMMIIFYLQQAPISILPSVHWLQRDPANNYIVDDWNTGFMYQREYLPPSSNTSSISELLGGFFEYYSMFNFEEMVVCPFLGVPLKKDAFKDLNQLPKEFERYKANVLNNYVMPIRYGSSFCVQDPFEQCHNVASPITYKLASDIKSYLKFAANAYEEHKLNNCQDFLNTILLQKPKLVRVKTHPEYRVNLFPRIIIRIIKSDWKSVVRKLILVIFEKMLMIKLGKVEEKVNTDTKKDKEKYSGTVTKAIWKRKLYTKLFGVMHLNFQQRQRRITEEILNFDESQFNMQFQMMLTFCHDPRSCVISIKYNTGDMDMFREFGKFFISVTQNWFLHLVKPYSYPFNKNMAEKIAETIELMDHNLDTLNGLDSDDDFLPPLETSSQSDRRLDDSTNLVQNIKDAVLVVENSIDTTDVVENTPVIVDKLTGTPVIVDKPTGTPVIVDKTTGTPVIVDKTTGTPVIVDKTTGTPVIVDKTTDTPVIVDKTIDTTVVVQNTTDIVKEPKSACAPE